MAAIDQPFNRTHHPSLVFPKSLLVLTPVIVLFVTRVVVPSAHHRSNFKIDALVLYNCGLFWVKDSVSLHSEKEAFLQLTIVWTNYRHQSLQRRMMGRGRGSSVPPSYVPTYTTLAQSSTVSTPSGRNDRLHCVNNLHGYEPSYIELHEIKSYESYCPPWLFFLVKFYV